MELFETLQLTFNRGKMNMNYRLYFLCAVLKSVLLLVLEFINMIKTDKIKIKNLEESYEDTL